MLYSASLLCNPFVFHFYEGLVLWGKNTIFVRADTYMTNPRKNWEDFWGKRWKYFEHDSIYWSLVTFPVCFYVSPGFWSSLQGHTPCWGKDTFPRRNVYSTSLSKEYIQCCHFIKFCSLQKSFCEYRDLFVFTEESQLTLLSWQFEDGIYLSP